MKIENLKDTIENKLWILKWPESTTLIGSGILFATHSDERLLVIFYEHNVVL